MAEPTGWISRLELIGYAKLPEVAAASQVVVQGQVKSVEYGPVPAEGNGIGYLRVNLDVERVFKGAPGLESVSYLTLGYKAGKESNEVYQTEGEHPLSAGMTGIWFLKESDIPGMTDELTPVGSAGLFVREQDSVLTSGDSQVAGELCKVSWSAFPGLVVDAVESSRSLKPLGPTDVSPDFDQDFSGNPCAPQSDNDTTQPTAPEGD